MNKYLTPLLLASTLGLISQTGLAEEESSTGEKIGRFIGDVGNGIQSAFDNSKEFVEESADSAEEKTKDWGDSTKQAFKDAVDGTAKFFDDIEKGIEKSE